MTSTTMRPSPAATAWRLNRSLEDKIEQLLSRYREVAAEELGV